MSIVYDIALGNKRTSVVTKPDRWEWGEIVSRLKKVSYGEHTVEQYKAMTKAQRIEVKDVGFFIGGLAQKRKVLYRQMLALDIDDADENTLTKLRTWLKDKTYILHSTHSSTPEQPRYRVVAPFDRVVQADEYGAIMRILHDIFSMPLDVGTFDFNRVMFFPSVPKDVDYFFETEKGEPLAVDELLESLPDWKNLADVPALTVRVQNPLKKGGLIGAFCSKIPIREAIETYLKDVWTKETDGTYTLAGASTTSGGKIYEDMFLVSFHSTDKYLGKSHTHTTLYVYTYMVVVKSETLRWWRYVRR